MDILLQFFFYFCRWQMSTPILAIFSALTVAKLSKKPLKWANKAEWWGAAVANAVGASVFFWVDMMIFKK